jgi:pyruvate dehydrogenase E2 component (dihydrolipoamide acetyltransferase)
VATVEDVLLPDIGDFTDVEIIEVLVAPGDRIEPEQSLLTLESDKATMEIPAPFGGVVKELKVTVGQRTSKDALLMTVATEGGEAGADDADPAAAADTGTDAATETTPQTAEAGAAEGTATAPEPAAAADGETAPDTAGAGAETEVRLPDIGDFHDVPIIELLVSEGDEVAVDQSILTLESDKATLEIPAPAAGVVTAVKVKVGDTLNQGDLLLMLRRRTGASVQPGPASASAPEAETPVPAASADPSSSPETAARAPGEAERRRVPLAARPEDLTRARSPHASPAVRRFARELGVDLAQVKGSGRKGRIRKDDVQAYVKQTLAKGVAPTPAAGLPFQLPAAPEVDFAKFGPVTTQPLPRIRRISGAHLHRSWLSVPHVTQFDEADITELEAFRKGQKAAADQSGVRLTFLPFLLKAVAAALARMPTLKASLAPDGENLVIKHYTHIGVAVDTPNGLVVPVLRDVDKKGVIDLARELMEQSAKARDGKLLPGDMQGGCFTITSLGGIGGTAFTPIINAPEVAILGVSRSETRPVWNGETFAPRLLLPLSLSYDHRVVDGADGVRFTSLLTALLADIRRLLL